MKYLMDLAFFFEPPLLAVVDFFVTLVDVLAKDDVGLVLVFVALGLAGAWLGVTVAAAGFFAASTF